MVTRLSSYPALVLNLLKDIPERSKISFNKFRTSATDTTEYLVSLVKSTIIILMLHLGINALATPTLPRISPCLHKNYTSLITYFHSIKCLAFSTYFFSRLDAQHYSYKLCNCIDHNTCVRIDSTQFFNPIIQTCIQDMCTTHSLKPLLVIMKNAQNYHLDHKHQFVSELFLLIFTIHKQILIQKCEEKEYALKTISLTTIIEIGEKINRLPIAELLNTIDMLMTELPPLLEKYEFNSTLSWKKWFAKHWWVLPVFGGWFVLRVLLSFQRSHYYFPSYRPPRPMSPTYYPDQTHQTTSNDPAWDEICGKRDYR